MTLDLFHNPDLAGADFSHDRKYRFRLWRIWDPEKPLVMFIGLNPSKADESKLDPTIESVIRISRTNGYGGFYMLNCWAFVSTDPKGLQHNPVSDRWNDDVLTTTAAKCKDVVFAWGNFQVVTDTGRNRELIEMFPRAKCIGLNKNGSPKHPLYQLETTILRPFK